MGPAVGSPTRAGLRGQQTLRLGVLRAAGDVGGPQHLAALYWGGGGGDGVEVSGGGVPGRFCCTVPGGVGAPDGRGELGLALAGPGGAPGGAAGQWSDADYPIAVQFIPLYSFIA